MVVGAAPLRFDDQSGRRIDHRRRADREEHVARRGRLGGAVEHRGVERLAEPHDAGPFEAAAVRHAAAGRRAAHQVAAGRPGRPRTRRRNARPRSSREGAARRRLPARSCSPSTFWVTSVKPGRADQRASTWCASLGAQAAMRCRRQSYHSHTSRGSRANAAGGGQVLGPMLAPQPVGAAKRRHAAGRRHAGAGEHGDSRPGPKMRGHHGGGIVEGRRRRSRPACHPRPDAPGIAPGSNASLERAR